MQVTNFPSAQETNLELVLLYIRDKLQADGINVVRVEKPVDGSVIIVTTDRVVSRETEEDISQCAQDKGYTVSFISAQEQK